MTWWITGAEQTLTEDVAAAPDLVRDYYVDLDNIKAVHPLVVAVRSLSRTDVADGYQQTYRVRDRIPLGMVSLPISYRARLSVPTHGAVRTEARQFPRVRLTGAVSFEPTDAGTRIVERIQIAAPRPLAAMTKRAAVSAHVAMLAGIRRHFESSA